MKLDRIVAAALALAITLSAGIAAAAGKPAPTGKVNINSASAEQLTALPGVGEKNFEKLQPYLTVGEAASKAGATR